MELQLKARASFALTMKAKSLIMSRKDSMFGRRAFEWTQKAVALLRLATQPPVVVEDPKPESNPDYQYLQLVIQGDLPNMNDPEIGVRLGEILERNKDDSPFISYLMQAMATYRQALISMSKQFLWGHA